MSRFMLATLLASASSAQVAAESADLQASCLARGDCSSAVLDEVALLQRQLSVSDGGGLAADADPVGIHTPGAWLQHGLPAFQSQASPVEATAYESCYLRDEDCSLSAMTGPTLVYPGGGTGCMNGDEYAFSVVPGDADKLAVFYEGGGACWEANGAFGKQVVLQCTNSLQGAIGQSGYGAGIQNLTNPSNPFKSYTIIEPLYCSGDAFMGNTTLEKDGKTFTQTGFANSMAAFTWAEKNLKKNLSSLVVTGYSAGALGTMAWAEKWLSAYSYTKGAVIMDSYAAAFPSSTQPATIQRWGACALPLFNADLQQMCDDGKVTVQAMIEVAMKKFPDVTFANVQSKTDGTQVWFYKGMAQSWGMKKDMGFTGPELYKATNGMFEEYHAGHDNWHVYYVDGSVHCFFNKPEFYTASDMGPNAAPTVVVPPVVVPTLVEWVSKIITQQPTKSQCDGPMKPSSEGDGVDYCDDKLLGQ